MSNITAFVCADVGVSGTTKVFVKETSPGEFEARVGIALLGITNMEAEKLKDANPFDEDFHDNYAHGVGKTQQEAIEEMKKDIGKIADSLWA